MKAGKFSAGVVLLLLAIALPLFAHHSLSAEFDLSKNIEVTGKIVEIYWSNPHVYVVVDTKTPKSNTTDLELWKLQMGSPACMQKHGVGPKTMVVGSTITVRSAPPLKSGSVTVPVFTVIYDNKSIRVLQSPSDPPLPAGNPSTGIDPWCAP